MSESPFDFPEGEEDESNEVGESSSIQDIRKFAKRLERQLKAAEKERDELKVNWETVIAERREAKIASAFNEVGLDPAHAELYRDLNPSVEVESITADAIAEFASKYKLPTQAGEAVETPEPEPVGYRPVATSGAAPLHQLSMAEFMDLQRRDPAAAREAWANGRVARPPTQN